VSLLMMAPTFVCDIETGLSMVGNTMNSIRQNQSVSNNNNRLYRHRTCCMYVTIAETDKQTVRDWKIA